jgi:hypothetical protein
VGTAVSVGVAVSVGCGVAVLVAVAVGVGCGVWVAVAWTVGGRATTVLAASGSVSQATREVVRIAKIIKVRSKRPLFFLIKIRE